MENIDTLLKDLPEPQNALRFFSDLTERHPSEARKLLKNRSLLSDLLTVAAYSPLLATTILQNPGYIRWLARERKNSQVREKEELLESLARFALTNTQLPPNLLLARFRRRELIRIFLKDVRNLGSIAEITEEISNLADAVLEYALQLSRQELENRYGMPLEIDENGKAARAGFCVIALGKLGSRELNYSSDIDLLFVYSSDGKTSGRGSKGAASNREYFVKLAEFISKIVSDQSGEGGAYRVDHRLRPYGRVGALAVSLQEATAYYRDSAQLWERQVLIRSRNSAGDTELFQRFYRAVEPFVFSETETVENALANVLKSKQKIDLEKIRSTGFDVKLGIGGIREIEFIAQALQLAFGAKDRWLRAPHTLISLSRLSDRKLIDEREFTALFDAYAFLRRVEHRLQMEYGLQTHLVPDDPAKRQLIAARMGFESDSAFESELKQHAANVRSVFTRFFDHTEYVGLSGEPDQKLSLGDPGEKVGTLSSAGTGRTIGKGPEGCSESALLERFRRNAPPFAEILQAMPELLESLPTGEDEVVIAKYGSLLRRASLEENFASRLAALRRSWLRSILGIASMDICEKLDLGTVKKLQTVLAEAAIETAVDITAGELRSIFKTDDLQFGLCVIGLGKLGGGGMDYHSDLDLLIVYNDQTPPPVEERTHAEFYAKAVEIFVTVLSSLTREGSLYRVDLRLRPDGKNGATSVGRGTLLDYLKSRSAVWEWLAYTKARSVLISEGMPVNIEDEIRETVHHNALGIDKSVLRDETWRIRHRLEKEKSGSRRGREIDIKYGEGGLQDVYFAIRYLQLSEGIRDCGDDRSTAFSLRRLLEAGAISLETYNKLDAGYGFLSALDHNIRLAVGRSTLVPLSNRPALDLIRRRMGYESENDLQVALAANRIAVREAFEEALGMVRGD